MGTNYYARTASCAHCGRSDGDIHIGKSLTMFQGYVDRGDGEGVYGCPWGEVKSWTDWRTILRERDVLVMDEYGAEHQVEDFITRVEATPLDARRRQYDWVATHYPNDHGDDWLDADGFSFCSRDFS